MLSLALHLWAVMSPAARVNSDEALTGLQAYNVLQGQFSSVVEGNDYGGTLEAYLTTPFLVVTSGTVALKIVPIVLSYLAGLALAWAAAPLLGTRVALITGATSWISSGAGVVLWSLNYMGYASGAIAMNVALGCAVRLMNRPSAYLALAAGLAGGVALWGHPIFGVVVGLAVLPVLIVIRSRPPLILVAAIGAVLGASPWLAYLLRSGPPRVPQAGPPSSYLDRIRIFVIELIPSGFGLRSPSSQWVDPSLLGHILGVSLIVAALAGLVALVVARGGTALPFVVAGVGAFPALAIFQALSFSADGRYAVAFMPMLIVGLFGWTSLRPGWSRPPLAIASAIPVMWGLLACVPSLHMSAGWTWQNANVDAERGVAALHERGISAVRGDYWSVYVLDYYSRGQLDAWPDSVPRLNEDASRAQSTPRSRVALAYDTGAVEKNAVTLPFSIESYVQVPDGRWELWVPARS